MSKNWKVGSKTLLRLFTFQQGNQNQIYIKSSNEN